MRQVVSISMGEDLVRKLNKLAKQKHTTRSDLVKEAVRQYVFLQETSRIRDELRPYAEKAGIYSEEDLLAKLS